MVWVILYLLLTGYKATLCKGVETRNQRNGEYAISVEDFSSVNSPLKESDYYTHRVRRDAGILHRTKRFGPVGPTRPGEATETHTCNYIRSVPTALRSAENIKPEGLDNYYQKYTEAYGIPVLSSKNVSDTALRRACYVVRFLFAGHSGVRKMFYKWSGRVALIGVDEQTTDIPEHSHLGDSWNARARGLGATTYDPICTGGEENVLCLKADRYDEQDIFLHELAHGVQILGAAKAIEGWDNNLMKAYKASMAAGRWKDTYAATNYIEYFAESTQSYFHVNAHRDEADGIYNHVSTRKVLKTYDPTLYKLIEEVFPCNNAYIKRCEKSRKKKKVPTATLR